MAGNTEALTSIRVPSEAEERSRSVSRQCEQLLEHRKRLAAQGLSCARSGSRNIGARCSRTKQIGSTS